MKEKRVAFDKFDFKGFIVSSIEFAKTQIAEGFEVFQVDSPGGIPEEFENCTNEEVLLKHLDSGKGLFFIFTSPGISEPIMCADGGAFEYDEEAEFIIGEVETIGFLIRKTGEELIINSALNSMGSCMMAPSVDILEDCAQFDEGMQKYIKAYINI